MSEPQRDVIYGIEVDYHGHPRLVSARVVHAGPRRVRIDYASVGQAFGYRTSLERERVLWTPDAAWDDFINAQRLLIAAAQNSIARAEEKIRLATANRQQKDVA